MFHCNKKKKKNRPQAMIPLGEPTKRATKKVSIFFQEFLIAFV